MICALLLRRSRNGRRGQIDQSRIAEAALGDVIDKLVDRRLEKLDQLSKASSIRESGDVDYKVTMRDLFPDEGRTIRRRPHRH